MKAHSSLLLFAANMDTCPMSIPQHPRSAMLSPQLADRLARWLANSIATRVCRRVGFGFAGNHTHLRMDKGSR